MWNICTTESCKYLKGGWSVVLLQEKTWRKQKNGIIAKRTIPSPGSPADSCQCCETHQCSLRNILLPWFLPVNQKKNMKMEQFKFFTVLKELYIMLFFCTKLEHVSILIQGESHENHPEIWSIVHIFKSSWLKKTWSCMAK